METENSKQEKIKYTKSDIIKAYLLYPDEKNNFDFDENKVMNIKDPVEKAKVLIEIIKSTPNNYINENHRKYDDSMACLYQTDIGRRFLEDGREILERDLKINKKAVNLFSKNIGEFSNVEDLSERAKILEWGVLFCNNTNSENARKLLLDNIQNFIKSEYLDERLLILYALEYCDEDKIAVLKKQCLDSLVSYIDNNRSRIDNFINSENNLSPETNEKCHSVYAAAFEYIAIEGSKDEALDYLKNLKISDGSKLFYYTNIAIKAKQEEIAYIAYKNLIGLEGEEIFDDKISELVHIAGETKHLKIAIMAINKSYNVNVRDTLKYIDYLRFYILDPYENRWHRWQPDIKEPVYKIAKKFEKEILSSICKNPQDSPVIMQKEDKEMLYIPVSTISTINDEHESLYILASKRKIGEDDFIIPNTSTN